MLDSVGGAVFLCAAVEVVVVALAFVALLRTGAPDIDRNRARTLLIVWGLFVTAEYWLLGPRSFVMVNDEGEFSLPLYLYLARWYQGGSFAHGVMGGIDARLLYGTQILGLERLLFDLLPGWVAMAVHKGMVVATAASGAYVLARRGAGADRLTAVALAMLVVFAHRYAVTVTVHHGVGFALVPWAAYILVTRAGRRGYWVGVAGLAVVHAVSSSATHSAMPFAMGATAVWLFTGRPRPRAFVGAMGLVIAVSGLNWHEVLFAMAQNGADSLRAQQTLGKQGSFLTMATTPLFYRMAELAPLGLAGLGVLLVRRSPHRWRAAGMMATVTLVGPALLFVPWRDLGLGQLAAIDMTYLTLGLPAVAVLVVGWAARPAAEKDAGFPANPAKPAKRVPVMVAATLALALGTAAWHKAWHGIQWLGMGGQSVTVAYETLARRPWAPAEPFRVVSVPYRLEANTVASYGLQTFDGLLNIVPVSRSQFWRNAFPDPNPGLTVGYTYIASHDALDFLCCRSYPLERLASADVLRLANVEFLLSLLPVTGEGIDQVAGPADGAVPPRRDQPMTARVKGFLDMLLGPVEVYVYRVRDPLPRAHMARSVETADQPPATPDAVRAIAARALAGAAVIRPEDAGALATGSGSVDRQGRVERIELVPDGYVVTVSAPNGGVLLLNQLWRPWWRVVIDGALAAPPVAANAVEMAVALPAGARRVEILYHRPLLRELMIGP